MKKVSTRIEFIPARVKDPWVPHQRISRVKLHHRIECVMDGTIVAVTLAVKALPHQVGMDDHYERIEGRRDGRLIRFLKPSTLYPGLTCTPWDQFAVQEVRLPVSHPEAARE